MCRRESESIDGVDGTARVALEEAEEQVVEARIVLGNVVPQLETTRRAHGA